MLAPPSTWRSGPRFSQSEFSKDDSGCYLVGPMWGAKWALSRWGTTLLPHLNSTAHHILRFLFPLPGPCKWGQEHSLNRRTNPSGKAETRLHVSLRFLSSSAQSGQSSLSLPWSLHRCYCRAEPSVDMGQEGAVKLCCVKQWTRGS